MRFKNKAMQIEEETYDVVVIGGGIAGCYAAYRLLQLHPQLRVKVFEAGSCLGGRARTETFSDVPVVTGAGVGRLHKDRLLLKLLRQLALKFSVFETAHHITSCEADDPGVASVARDFSRLVSAHRRGSFPPMTFKAFARPRLEDYDSFVANAGYTDFEDADASDVLNHYSFEDNCTSWTAFSVPWSALVAAMTRNIPCVLQRRVTRLARLPDGTLRIYTSSHPERQYTHARKVIIATNAAGLRQLLPAYQKMYKHIHGQPFLRVYGAFEPASASILSRAICESGVTVLPDSPLQKALHMKDNVYMVAYCDNANATYLRRHVSNKALLCALLERALKLEPGVLHMTAVRAYFWEAGTHYFDPLHRPFASRQEFLKAARHPAPGVFVVGECIALHQGWVEGAFETVEAVLGR